MANYRHWSVSLWRDPDDVPHCRSCPLTKLNGGLSRLHSANKDAVSWPTNYGQWHAHEKKTAPSNSWAGMVLSCLCSDISLPLYNNRCQPFVTLQQNVYNYCYKTFTRDSQWLWDHTAIILPSRGGNTLLGARLVMPSTMDRVGMVRFTHWVKPVG